MGRIKNILDVVVLSLLIKFLLVPAYISTDFDVHRNWLRIAYNEPLTNWYVDSKSQWTLDYPPFFAYFQYFLSLVGGFVYPSIISGQYLQCQSKGCVLFQRSTVILSQFVYLAAIIYILKQKISFRKLIVLFLQYGFILLDDVHFQYNSMMQGIFLFSIQFMVEGKILLGAGLYSILLNFKHIYLYVAPIYFIYILKFYVLDETKMKTRINKFFKVAIVTLVPFIIAFGPFVILGGFQQITYILGRLFPFGRGLVHSYWAPNAWAYYCSFDRLLAAVFKQPIYLVEGFREGLRILPQIPPIMTILCILTSSLPLYKKCIQQKNNFKKCIVVAGLIFCFFGYHVHQKAFLIYINILLIFGGEMYWDQVFVNSVSLMPLLYRAYERILKIVGLIIYMGYWGQNKLRCKKSKFIVITGGLILFYHQCLHPFTTLRYYFLPLMMYSVWAGFFYGLLIIRLYGQVLRNEEFKQIQKCYSGYEQISSNDIDIYN